MSAPTPPGRTPPETHSSSVGTGQLQEHSASSASTAQAATPHNGELFHLRPLHENLQQRLRALFCLINGVVD